MKLISQSQNQINQSDIDGRKWIVDNLSFETKRLLRQSETSNQELERLKKETLDSKIKVLKRTNSNDNYDDVFNRTVCITADKLGISLIDAEKIVREEIKKAIKEKDIEEYLSMDLKSQEERRLKTLLSRNLEKVLTLEKALTFTSILFEIDQIKTDKVWNTSKFEKILFAGLNGEKLNLITMLCSINKFDNEGGYTAIDDLFAYLKDSKLKPIPLILKEMLTIIQFITFYGIDSSLTIYVADTDYTETGRYGNVTKENVQNIQKYIQNIKAFAASLSNKISVLAFSEVIKGNTLYNEVKQRIFKNVSSFKNVDFEREWGKKFEDAVEKIVESQQKKKLFPKKDIRQKSLEITKNIWACNAAEGAFIGTLEPNTIFVSTENRVRDQNYIIDSTGRENFPPVIYVLNETEKWYQITGKGPTKQV